MKNIFLFFALVIFFTGSVFAENGQPLPADQAFQLSATARDYQTVLLKWKIAPGYYLYQKHFSFRAIKPLHAALGDPLYPSNTQILKTMLGNFDVYAHSVIIPLPVIESNEKTLVLQVNYQGCSQFGYCYPPTAKTVSVDLAGNYMHYFSPVRIDFVPTAQNNVSYAPSSHHSVFWMIVSFFGFGILLSLTPCVLPMIPILSGIIVGQKNKSHFHAFCLSLFYVCGMAICYAAIGVLFALLGKNVQLLFQQPWIMLCFAIVFVVMSLSLFGLFQIQLPAKLRSAIAEKSYHQKSGTYFGALMMGILSTLILSPCVTPPLVAALSIISKDGNMVLGGFALFSMGFGMGLPLLLIGLLGSRILPKPGKWMNVVKYFFAVMLLLMAFMIFQRAEPNLFSTSFFSDNQAQTKLHFQPVNTKQEVDAIIKKADAKHQLVMLDFYANWCLDCKTLEITTFANPLVITALSHTVLLRADISKNSTQDQLLAQQYGVIAPPTILFFYNGKELVNSRVIGYRSAKAFVSKLPTSASN